MPKVSVEFIFAPKALKEINYFQHESFPTNYLSYDLLTCGDNYLYDNFDVNMTSTYYQTHFFHTIENRCLLSLLGKFQHFHMKEVSARKNK